MTALTRGRVISLSAQDAGSAPREHREPAAMGRMAHDDQVTVAARAKRIVDNAEAAAAARLAEVREQMRAELALELTQKLLELATLRARVLERAETDIIQIARLLAERIIAEELALDPGKLVLMARQALREVGGATQVRIVAAPGAVEALRHEMSRLESSCAVRIEIVSDVNLGPGDLRLETDVGSIDARIGTQLTHLAAAVFESNRS
jgi:flagellar biosynthesis/type III secretory pathway protein FliH